MEIKRNNALLTGIAAILVTGLVLLHSCTTAEAQFEVSFTPVDRFSIPSLNGAIGFAVNGTYANATLVNDTWNFADLKLNGSEPLSTLKVSTENSSIIITSYRAANTTFRTSRLRYVAESRGQQTFNIGIAAGEGQQGLHPEWSVVVEGVWMGEGDGWSITLDGTMTVTGAVGNVSIVHYNFRSLNDDSSNLPFYKQHSVAITTATLAIITVTVAVLLRVKNKSDHTGK